MRAKTPEQVAEVVAREASRIVGDTVAVDFSGADVELARQYGEGLLQGFERYPTTPLREIGTYGPGGSGTATAQLADQSTLTGAYAFAIRGGETDGAGGTFRTPSAQLPNGNHTTGTAIYFNNRIGQADYDARARVRELETQGRLQGRAQVSTTPRETALHEFAHSIGRHGRPGNPEEAVGKAAQTAAASAGKSTAEYVRSVSHYATKDSAELTAEVFADVVSNGKKASPVSQELFAVMETNVRGWEAEVSAPSNRLSTLVARTRLRNHPGHPDQKSHGRKGGKGKAADSQIRALPRVENPDDRQAQAKGANPKWGGPYEGPVTDEVRDAGGVGYATNCSRCAVAYELRRRGYDVTAGAGTPMGDTTAVYVRTFREDGKYGMRVAQDLRRQMSAREIAAEVETWPRGARGIVTMKGHTLNVERDATTGKAVFIDTQQTRRQPVMSLSAFQRRWKSSGTSTEEHMAVARVDDLDLSDYGLRYVESSPLRIADGQVGKTRYPQDPDSPTFSTDEEILAMTPDDSYP